MEKGNKDLVDLIKFLGSNLKLIRLRGYSHGNTDYSKAKTPVGKWQDAEPLTNRELVEHIKNNGWVGLVVPDGLLIADIDNPSTGKPIHEGLRRADIKHIAIKTPHGFQFIFKNTLKVKTQGSKMLTVGGFLSDYRLSGRGYIVLPCQNTENREVIYLPNEVDPMPDIFIPIYQAKEKDELLSLPIAEGNRNDVLFRHACRLHAWNKKYALGIDVLSILLLINDILCLPPLQEEEIRQCSESSLKYSYDAISETNHPNNEGTVIDTEMRVISGSEAFRLWKEEYSSNHLSETKKVSVGVPILDIRLDGGFQQEQMAVIGGLPGTGKTALSLQIAGNMAEQGNIVTIYNFEMSNNSLIQRFVAQSSKIPMSDLSKCEVKPEVVFEPFCLSNIYFASADTRLTAKKIQEDIEYIKSEKNLEHGTLVVIFDYLQRLPHLHGKNRDVRVQINENLNILKEIAVRNSALVICICALNRESAKSGVDITSFRETSEIEYASDVLIGMGTTIKDKNGSYVIARKDDLQESRQETDVVVQVKFLKVRHYREGECLLNFHRNYQRFEAFMGEN